MTFQQIVDLVVAKVGEVDDYARARCLEYVKNRHRMIYDSFDWTAAQDTIAQRVEALQGSIEVPSAEKIISARFLSDSRPGNSQGNFLDPVSLSYIYESHPEMLAQPGIPIYYWSGFKPDTHSIIARPFPTPLLAGTLSMLIKRQFSDTGFVHNDGGVEPILPDIEDALITFVLADMWEYMRQLGKHEIKLKKAEELLQAAQQRDTPAAPKPRTSKVLTSSGVTLVELTDSVCDIIGKWEPDVRESVKERIRRNYQILWDMFLWPESTIIASVPISPDQQQVVLPHLFDRVMEVRTNKGGPLAAVTPLRSAEISLYFGVSPEIFEQSGEPIFFSMLPSVGVSVLPPLREKLEFSSSSGVDAGLVVFVKGESVGISVSENLTLEIGVSDLPVATSANDYDTPLTITKPDTTGTLTVKGLTSQHELLRLGPQERERKHIRVWLLPNKGGYPGPLPDPVPSVNDPGPGDVLVLGKRQVSPLVDDGDTPQLRNVQNALINAAASDILNRPNGNPELAQQLATKAQAQVQVLVKAETEQNAYQPQILPYTEIRSSRRGGFLF